MDLTSKQRAQLRGLANGIDTILQIGKDGIGKNLVKQADDALEARELIKGKVLENNLEYDARTAADAALQAALAKKGNVWAEFYTYTGNGTYGGDNPCHIPFTKGEPLLVLVFGSSNDDLLLHRGLVQTNNHSNYCHVSWQSSGVFWYAYKDAVYQLNVNGRTYTALMLYKLD